MILMLLLLRHNVRKVLAYSFLRELSSQKKMRILNVAEKNDAAKTIAALLSRGTATRREGLSVFNKVYEFECEVFGQSCTMIMTSVTGHLFEPSFDGRYNIWTSCDPVSLFEAPIKSFINSKSNSIKNTLEKEIKHCSKLIIWTDCDREGENIGFQIITVCKKVKKDIDIHRAKFSELNFESVKKALRNLVPPNKHVNSAVEVRKELDFRIGAAFTRLQTLFLKKAFPDVFSQNIISYGTCQFPTLGFVVDRFKAITEFKSEKFWLINVQHTVNSLSVGFQWKRNVLFDKLACEVLYEKCAENGTAKVENIESKQQTKYRPKPLDTITLQKVASTKFKMTAKEVMIIAENLYVKGLISYPRTETNFFSKEINLLQLVKYQADHPEWGGFAKKVLKEGPDPFQGNKCDEAHSPIHPINCSDSLCGNEKKVYEFIVRHFLACLSKHAKGLKTTVDIDVAGEKFSAKGLMVTAKNYLEVYPYEKWNDKEIHNYTVGEIFNPKLSMEEGETSPPSLLTEADLIGLMEKHGIGTDSTQAEHIETIKTRLYVGLKDEKYFVPGTLGMALVEGYNNMGHCMAKPELRAELEADLKRICNMQKSPAEVLTSYISKYKTVYEDVQRKIKCLSDTVQNYTEIEATPVEPGFWSKNFSVPVGKCPTCRSDLILKNKNNRNKKNVKFISCSNYPQCSFNLWVPSFVLDVTTTTNVCPMCGPNIHLLRFKFQKGSCFYPLDHIGCIGGCDRDLLRLLNFNPLGGEVTTVSKRGSLSERPSSNLEEINDSGFDSLHDSSPSKFSLSSPPKCHCGLPAVSFTVKKLGPNSGREFYTCGAYERSSKCDFFKWKTARSIQNKNKSRNIVVDNGGMRCYCSIPCRRATCTQEGPNKGRAYYTCGNSRKCGFFKWDDHGRNLNFESVNRKAVAGVTEKKQK